MKYKIIIKGKVHEVGYRLFLISTAERYGIRKFFAENVEIENKQAVLCYVGATDEQLKEFKDFILNNKPEKAKVESIDFEDYDGFITDIENYHRFFSQQQLYKIAVIGATMLEKQDETIEVIKDESEKTRQTVREESEKTRQTVIEESEKTRLELKDEIRDLKKEVTNIRFDFKEFMESNIKPMREEISEIKKALKKAGIM